MVEAVLQVALQAGIAEVEFWRLTPYQSVVQIKAAQRGRVEMAWLNERFAREKTLNPLDHYVSDKPAETVDMASAMRDWAKRNDAKFRAKGG